MSYESYCTAVRIVLTIYLIAFMLCVLSIAMYLPQSGCSRHTNKSTPADGVTHPIDTNVFKIKKINYERKKNLFTY